MLGLALTGATTATLVVILAYPNLPTLEALTDYRPKIPLRAYTEDGHLIGEFGEERRSLVQIKDVPEELKKAILAAEDDKFYEHHGVDYEGVIRAALMNFVKRGRSQGASTITMQVARNFYLTRDKDYSRKLYEVLLAFKIESSLSKDQILELYINQIFLGQRAYGFNAASRIYFGKPLGELNLAEIAMLAGLPQAPSKGNPVVNPTQAKYRQLYVLDRMLKLGYITQLEYQTAKNTEIVVKRELNVYGAKADYVAEMIRAYLYDKYGENAYTHGLRVTTTINKADQEAATEVMRRGLIIYDRQQGYRGPEAFENIRGMDSKKLDDIIEKYPDVGNLLAAVVLDASKTKVLAYRNGEQLEITGNGLNFAKASLSDSVAEARRIRQGSIIRVIRDDKQQWVIVQQPAVEGAMIVGDPKTGAIRALVGGFDFNRNHFNHATQAWRQPGSTFKPFIYSASLEKGFTPASILDDSPLIFDSTKTGSRSWSPQNYDLTFRGAMTMRQAIAMSRNVPVVRVLNAIGTKYAQNFVSRFGFSSSRQPPYLTMALGAGEVTVQQMFGAYSVFANGGFRITPYLIKQIVDGRGEVIFESKPPLAGNENNRVLDARNAFLMNSMLMDVCQSGTAARAGATLRRKDIAGKTGTTNDYHDAWFAGYTPNLVAVVWVGFDQPKRLGSSATGGRIALPIWIDYMKYALNGVKETFMELPTGIVSASIGVGDDDVGNTEFFYKESVPKPEPVDENASSDTTAPASTPSDEPMRDPPPYLLPLP